MVIGGVLNVAELFQWQSRTNHGQVVRPNPPSVHKEKRLVVAQQHPHEERPRGKRRWEALRNDFSENPGEIVQKIVAVMFLNGYSYIYIWDYNSCNEGYSIWYVTISQLWWLVAIAVERVKVNDGSCNNSGFVWICLKIVEKIVKKHIKQNERIWWNIETMFANDKDFKAAKTKCLKLFGWYFEWMIALIIPSPPNKHKTFTFFVIDLVQTSNMFPLQGLRKTQGRNLKLRPTTYTVVHTNASWETYTERNDAPKTSSELQVRQKTMDLHGKKNKHAVSTLMKIGSSLPKNLPGSDVLPTFTGIDQGWSINRLAPWASAPDTFQSVTCCVSQKHDLWAWRKGDNTSQPY